jgi:predicted transcriptional regulator
LDIIPALRKELAKLLTGKYEMSYEKAGDILGIVKPRFHSFFQIKRANK